MAKVNLNSLDKALPNRTAGKTKKRRVSDHSRSDKVAEALSKCDSASAIGNLAMQFGISEKEIRARAAAAPNFGQFRMVVGNRVRGIARRVAKAKQKGQKLTLTDAAYPKAKAGGGAKKVEKAKKAKKR